MKQSGPARDWEETDRHDEGVGWIAHPGETMERASHALAVDGKVWVLDPVDAEGIDDLFAEYGEVAGVVVLLDRHKRDAGVVARRHDVSVWVPEFMDEVAGAIDAPTERFRHDLADTGYTAHPLVDNRLWQEAFLYSDESGVLYVPEAVGTTSYFRTAEVPLGVHPMLRMTPPERLTRLEPDRLLVGHGSGLDEDVPDALEQAISGARRRAPRLMYKNVKNLVLG